MRLFLSILATLAVSLVLGLGAWFFHVTFWGTTIIAFVFQLILFYMFYSWLMVKGEGFIAQQLEAIAKQSLAVSCAFCKTIASVPVRLDIENELVCPKCEKTSAVLIEVSTAQKTTPLATNVPSKLPKEVVDELAAVVLSKKTHAPVIE